MSLYLRNRWQQLYKNLLHSSIQELLVEDLQTPALIFSPHPDDETLGCGGTIIRKKKLGADVKIIFMTDGSNSHSHLIASEKLKSIRTEEALSAAEKMGLAKEDIYFLEFSDGNLIKHYGKAIVKVKEILALYPGYQLFIPYRQEAPKDHFVTNKIVRNVLKSIDRWSRFKSN
jgi:LmbE family N-acetylglucosaminyl deacetylase